MQRAPNEQKHFSFRSKTHHWWSCGKDGGVCRHLPCVRNLRNHAAPDKETTVASRANINHQLMVTGCVPSQHLPQPTLCPKPCPPWRQLVHSALIATPCVPCAHTRSMSGVPPTHSEAGNLEMTGQTRKKIVSASVTMFQCKSSLLFNMVRPKNEMPGLLRAHSHSQCLLLSPPLGPKVHGCAHAPSALALCFAQIFRFLCLGCNIFTSSSAAGGSSPAASACAIFASRSAFLWSFLDISFCSASISWRLFFLRICTSTANKGIEWKKGKGENADTRLLMHPLLESCGASVGRSLVYWGDAGSSGGHNTVNVCANLAMSKASFASCSTETPQETLSCIPMTSRCGGGLLGHAESALPEI